MESNIFRYVDSKEQKIYEDFNRVIAELKSEINSIKFQIMLLNDYINNIKNAVNKL